MRWLVVCATLIASAIAWSVINRAEFGIPNFRVWRVISGEAHGGARINLDGVQIYYETFGRGPPVLVLHGGTARLETMHNQIVALASDHFVIAPDSRGHGLSTDGPGPMHYDDMAADMIGLMDRLHIAKADIVGWSDGGIVGLDMAMRNPGRVNRLVAIGANFDVNGLKASPETVESPFDRAVAAPRAIYHLLLSPTSSRERARDGKVYRMWRTEPHFAIADLARIRCPVLIIASEHDAIRRDHTDALARAIPGAREMIIPGTDHMAPLHDPGSIDVRIRGFLGSGATVPG